MSKEKRTPPTPSKPSSPDPDETAMQEAVEPGHLTEGEVTPTWFSSTYTEEDSNDLVERYRSSRAQDPVFETPSPEAYEAYRRRLEERFQSAKRMAAGPVPAFSTMDEVPQRRHAVNAAEDEGSKRFKDWQRKMNKRNGQREPQEGPARLSPLRIAGFFAAACAIGGLAGFGSANMDLVRSSTSAIASAASSGAATVMAYMPEWKEEPATGGSSGGSTVLTKKPVKIARVDVNDASGALNNPIPLDLAAIPAENDAPLALKITGLPGDAYLTQGTEIADGEWMLKPGEIEGVKLVVPQAETPQLDLAVAAVEEKTGTQAAPPREMTVELDLNALKVLPANAPPEVQSGTLPPLPQAIPLPQEVENSEAQTLFSKGEALLKTGDLVSARQFFMKAHGLGLADAAFGVGQCYDPAVYAAMNVHGLQPDAAKARQWYEKAAAAGHEKAKAALQAIAATAAQ